MIKRQLVASIFASGLDHPEGLALAPDGTIWAGGEEGQVYVVTPDGQVAEHARTGGFSGGLAFDRIGASVGGIPMRVPNFPVFGPDGSLYVSDSGSWDVADGVIYRLTPQGSGTVFHAGPFHYANGLAIDAAGEFLYVAETGRHCVVRIRIAEGSAAVPEPVCRPRSLRWMPDGLALDAAGNLYVTMYGSDRIYRIAPGGQPEILVQDRLGISLNRPTNCAFGGPAFDRLFIANLGGRHLSVVDLGEQGQPLFGGPH
jgi:gluconolactonase